MFDENTETIDSYVIRIRQVANLLGYGKPQILEVFKNHSTDKIVLDLVPNRRSQTSCRYCQKNTYQRKLDKQLTGQTSTSPIYEYQRGYKQKSVI